MAYVRTRLGRWFYEERGEAKREGDPAIILLHGVLLDGGVWRKQVEALSALGRVIVIDGPGHGKSEAPPRFSLEDHADALAGDVFHELKITKAIFVGLSWGGMVAMRIAIKHPMKVAGLVLVDTDAQAEELANKVKYRLLTALWRRVGMPPFVGELEVAPLFFSPQSIRAQPDLVEKFIRTVNGYSRDGVARALLAVVVHRTDITPKLRSVAAPTLILCGREDRATPPEKSQALAANIRGAKLEWIEGAGHTSPLEQPEAVNRVLVPFVKEQLAAR